MNIVKTGINITKILRNISRFREIVSIFAKNGFDEFLASGLGSKIPDFVIPKSKKNISQEILESEDKNWHQVIGLRLRKSFEELGPAFVKFGQLLSSREDIFDQAFIDEMKKLRDQVKPVPIADAKREIEVAYGKKLEDIFVNFNEKPIGTASIGTVYRATLKTGEQVVVKVRRPNIEKQIETDFSILFFIIEQIERASSEVRYLGISRIVRDFSTTLHNELNFHIEASNCKRFKINLSRNDNKGHFYVPKIFDEYTKENVLVMEFLDGIPFSRVQEINPHIVELKEKLNYGLTLFIKSFLQDGFFHADLHGGNFFLLKDSRIGIVDYGLMGVLGRKSRQNLVAILFALISYNYENLIYEFLDVAEYDKIPDIDVLIADVKDGLSPYVGLTVQQTNYSEVFQVIMKTLNKHQLFLPRDWFVVFRGLITLDGVGKSLNIDFDLFGMLDKDIKEIVKSNFKKEDIIEEALWASRDIIPSLRMIPRHLRWFVKDISKNNYALEIKSTGYENSLSMIGKALGFIGFSIFATVLVYCGSIPVSSNSITNWADIPILTWIFWGAGILTFFRGLFLIR